MRHLLPRSSGCVCVAVVVIGITQRPLCDTCPMVVVILGPSIASPLNGMISER